MTLTELLSMPKGVTVEEYERLLKQKENLYRRISGLTEKILTEEDSIFVLSDEVGSDRYNKHVEAKKKFEDKRTKLLQELDNLETIIREGK